MTHIYYLLPALPHALVLLAVLSAAMFVGIGIRGVETDDDFRRQRGYPARGAGGHVGGTSYAPPPPPANPPQRPRAPVRVAPENCRNCGAPPSTHAGRACAYCGTAWAHPVTGSLRETPGLAAVVEFGERPNPPPGIALPR